MENVYKDAKTMTNSVINIYLTLAKLEKEGKTKGNEYKELFLLLTKASELEKRKYAIVTPLKKDICTNFANIEVATSGGGYFPKLTKEYLSAIRTLNFLDKTKYYALDGLLFREPNYLQLQKYLEEAFLYEILQYLKIAKREEKEMLIDFKYALLATTEIATTESLLPEPNIGLTEEEMHGAINYILPKVQVLTNKLIEMKDNDINAETILWVLYTKACIHLLPPLFEGVVLEEMRNAIGLNKILGNISGRQNKKMCDMLSYLNIERNTIGRKK